MLQTIIELIEKNKVMDAFLILEKQKDLPYYHTVRGLMRELVSDMNNAMVDVKNELHQNNPIIDISYGRLLAKLGYSDQAYQVLIDCPKNIKRQTHFYPLSLSILHSHYEAPVMEKMDANYFRDSLNYSYFLRGYKKKLIVNKVDNLLENLSLFDLPSGEVLSDLSNRLNEQLIHIRGWLSPSEASILYYYAKEVSKKNLIIELGSFYGRSTVSLCLGSVEGNNSKIIAIDPHIGIDSYASSDSYGELVHNLERFGLENNVSILREESLKAASIHSRKNIGLIFIDALHDYENVKADFNSWEKQVVDEGYILFHDAMLSGVNKFLIEILNDDNLQYQALGFRDSILVLQKIKPNLQLNEKIVGLLKEYGQYHKQWVKDDRESIIWRIKNLLKKPVPSRVADPPTNS